MSWSPTNGAVELQGLSPSTGKRIGPSAGVPLKPFTSQAPLSNLTNIPAAPANVGRRRANAGPGPLLASPARPGHSCKMAQIFQEAGLSMRRDGENVPATTPSATGLKDRPSLTTPQRPPKGVRQDSAGSFGGVFLPRNGPIAKSQSNVDASTAATDSIYPTLPIPEDTVSDARPRPQIVSPLSTRPTGIRGIARRPPSAIFTPVKQNISAPPTRFSRPTQKLSTDIAFSSTRPPAHARNDSGYSGYDPGSSSGSWSGDSQFFHPVVDSATKRALKAAKQQTQTSAELAQQHESAVHVNGKHEAGQRSVAHSKSHELITSWLNDIDPSASSPSHESLDYRKNPAHTFDDEEYTIHSPGLKFNICPTSADPIPTNAYAAPPPVFGLTGVASASAFSSSSSSSSSATGEPAAAATPAYLQSYCNRWQIPMSSVAAALSPARETLRLRGKKQGQEKEPKRKMRAEAENGNENIALLPFMSAKEIEDAKASFRQYFDSTGTGAGSPRVREDSVLGTVDMNVVTKVDVTTPIYGTAGPNDDMTKSTYATARVTPSTPTQHVCSDPAHDADGERDLTPLSPTISLHRGDSDARRRREKKEGKKRCPSYSDRDIISSPGRLTSQGWVWLGR